MATIHVSRSGANLGTFAEEKVREGLRTGEFIGTDLGWMEGMATWRPLSELEDFQTIPPPPVVEPTLLPCRGLAVLTLLFAIRAGYRAWGSACIAATLLICTP